MPTFVVTMYSDTLNTVLGYVVTAIAALFAIMLHEIAHGFVAYKLGDPTAKEQGRLSLNPIRHVDWMGLLMMIVVRFGWAKPVPVDIRYFKNPKQGMSIVALAGPLMNFALALVSLLIWSFTRMTAASHLALYWIDQFLQTFIILNVGLGVFNLLPIPPLDGSKIVGLLLPDNVYYRVLQYERYGMFLLMVLLLTGWITPALSFLRTLALSGLEFVAFLPYQLVQNFLS